MKVLIFAEIVSLCFALSFETAFTCPRQNNLVKRYILTSLLDLIDEIEDNTPPVIGSTYIRWGRTVCPNNTGTEVIYSGRAAGSDYRATGGGSNLLCLPDNPDYLDRTANSVQGHSPLTGAEFHTWVAREDLLRQNAPCAVCQVPRAMSLMIPAKTVCPPSWTLEYVGYIISKYHTQGFLEYSCLDKDPEFIPGEERVTGGVTIHLVEATCNKGLSCPPYSPGKEIACVVCTK